MKKLRYILLSVIIAFSLSACSDSYKAESENLNVVASFYPIYIIAQNVIGDAEGISLENMAQPQTGCLHDYQLSSGDMRKLNQADLFIVNGGGMESFLDNALELFPDLNIIDTSEGVTKLSEHEHEHEHENSKSHSHESNPHFWLYPENAAVQADNICKALSAICPDNAEVFKKNTDSFIERINSLECPDFGHKKTVVFNEAYEYFELTYGIDVEFCIAMDENQTPSAKELAEIITNVKSENIRLLIAADDASKVLADTIAAETDAEVIILDPVLTGDYSQDRYIEAMKKNTSILKGSVLS